MARAKIAITMDEQTLQRIDQLVAAGVFPNRSQAIQAAVSERLERLDHTRLARECAKLDADVEQALAEEGMSQEESGWPEY
ncbi:MAG: ribbon-helix-helix domain-containing protein [Thermoanaerobaculia bacterium]